MSKKLMKGNVAIAEAAVRAGCEAYFGYPITPQTELLEYMSKRMIELGRVFLQAESEVAAVNMVYGAAASGVRVMTSSSSPGISLMQEGFSYMAGSDVPAVIVDVMRGGPGLANPANPTTTRSPNRPGTAISTPSPWLRLRCRKPLTSPYWPSTWPKNTALLPSWSRMAPSAR